MTVTIEQLMTAPADQHQKGGHPPMNNSREALRKQLPVNDPEALSEVITWKPEQAGDELYGVLVSADTVSTKYGLQVVLEVLGENDQRYRLWASNKVLQEELLRVRPALGSDILIEFGGQRLSQSGNPYNLWRVAASASYAPLWSDKFLEETA